MLCSLAIFPEGGSHDRTELLPLKPGVAIMALRAAMEGAEDILVVPLGLNYYQAHKILSRATIQVGTPIVIRDELVQLYQKDRREAVAELLSEIEQVSNSPSYITMAIYISISVSNRFLILLLHRRRTSDFNQYY